jgi:simple sugar transport system permease protein
MAVTEAPPGPQADERVRRAGLLRRLLARPELGAVAGAILVWVFFALVAGNRGFLTLDGTASYLAVASELGILAVAVSLLMIAGEFDLSIGSIIGASGMVIAMLNIEYGWPLWAAIVMAIAFSLVAGFLNGLVVVWTRLPSFIVTLASLFIFRGLTIGITRLVTGRTQLGGIDTDAPVVSWLFGGEIGRFSVSIVWWLALAALATWVLLRTRVGNWIFGAGGAPDASRNLGVPVNRLKIGLFMTTAFSACLVAILQVVNFGGADVLRGTGQEFQAIIAVVIGGTLLTGGTGYVLGSVVGVLVLGIVQTFIAYDGTLSSWWTKIVIGGLLLVFILLQRLFARKAG